MNKQLSFEAALFEFDSECQSMDRVGRWVRRGSMIVVLPDTNPLPDGQEVYELSGGSISPATPRVLTYSAKDVIDKRISIPAQHSLVRLSKNPATSADAVGMLEEVKAGRLAGIYCVNWEKPAQRALRLGKSWWTVIPQGEDAVVMLDPDNLSGGQPMIAFRRELDPDCGLLKSEKKFNASPTRLDAALRKAWATYQLMRTGKLTRCRIRQGEILAAELAPSHHVLSNVVPPLFCQVPVPSSLCQVPVPMTFRQARPPAPKLVGDTKFEKELLPDVSPAGIQRLLQENVICVVGLHKAFHWIASGSVHFPHGMKPCFWQTGFVQNVVGWHFSATYLNEDPRTFTLTRPLLDITPGGLDPFVHDLAAILADPRQPGTQAIFGDVMQSFSVGKPFTETLKVHYTDRPSMRVVRKVHPKNPLVHLKESITFRAHLISLSDAGDVVPHAASDPFTLELTIQVDEKGRLWSNSTVNLGVFLRRSNVMPILGGEIAGNFARQKIKELGIAPHPRACLLGQSKLTRSLGYALT